MISSCAFVRFWLLIGITLVYILVTVDAANGENDKKQYDYEESSGNPFFEVCNYKPVSFAFAYQTILGMIMDNLTIHGMILFTLLRF